MGTIFSVGDRVRVNWKPSHPERGWGDFDEIEKVNGKSGVIVQARKETHLVQIDGWSCELYIPETHLVKE